MSWLARSFANSLRLEDDDDGGKSCDDDDEDNDVAPAHPNDLPPQRLLADSTPSSPSLISSTQNENYYSQPHQLQYQQRQEQHDYQKRDQQYSTLENGSLSPSPTEYDLQSRGVKDDLNEFKQTLTRQFWGMANFIAPQPSNHSHVQNEIDPTLFRGTQSGPQDFPHDDQESMSDAAVSGNRSELSEMEKRLKTEVSETCRHDPNLDRLGSKSERNEDSGNEEWDIGQETGVVGITEEVLAFAINIAMHPETWLDFPIEEEEDTDDFPMSDAQKYHSLAIERLTPRLAALRIELCPCHMSESYFWKVYFVLLHSRLNKQDAEVLSTSQVMAARAKWMQELHKQMQPESDWFSSTSYSKDVVLHDDPHPGVLNDSYSENTPHGIYMYESTTPTTRTDFETEKHTVETSGMHYVDKPVIVEKPVIKTEMNHVMVDRLLQECDDDNDWPEDDSDFGGTTIPIENEDDISFSDLEDDSFDKFPEKCNTVRNPL